MGLLGFYFQPAGRIARSRFWLGLLGLVIIVSAIKFWLMTSLLGIDPLASAQVQLTRTGVELSLLIDLIFLFPTFVLLAKRFHDRNKSAAWSLPFLLSSVATDGGILFGWLPSQLPIDPASIKPEGMALAFGSTLIILWTVIELGCLRGTRGVNRFGADPLGS